MERLILSSAGLYPPSKGPDVLTRKLALGILLQALRDLSARAGCRSKEKEHWRQDAVQWFASDDVGPGSLEWVCSVLRIEAAGLRERTALRSSLDLSKVHISRAEKLVVFAYPWIYT